VSFFFFIIIRPTHVEKKIRWDCLCIHYDLFESVLAGANELLLNVLKQITHWPWIPLESGTFCLEAAID
jgi:hypothetical protein